MLLHYIFVHHEGVARLSSVYDDEKCMLPSQPLHEACVWPQSWRILYLCTLNRAANREALQLEIAARSAPQKNPGGIPIYHLLDLELFSRAPSTVHRVSLIIILITPKMAALQTLHLAHLPPDLAVHIALYTDLQNASFLRDQLLRGNSDFEYAFVDASVVSKKTP